MTVGARQVQLDEVCAEVFGPPTPPAPATTPAAAPIAIDDIELVEKMLTSKVGHRIEPLWRGDTGGYPSASEADLAFCNYLAYWTGGDPDRMDRLYRQSDLYASRKEKWGRDDYRMGTIAKAIEGCTNFYEPRVAVGPQRESVADSTPAPPATTPTPAKFIARRLAEELAEETPVATNASGRLHVYRDGVYQPGGEHDLRQRIALRLGDEWKRFRADETLGYLRDSSPKLWPQPPLNRINCLNGIVDIIGRLEPHNPGFLSPIQIGAAFDPDAECPAIDAFLDDILPPDLVRFVHELAGYLIVPDGTIQVAMMFLGEGANGKSTLLNLLTALIGPQNVASVALHRLDEDRFAVAELEGRLANVFADLDARALQASSMFKAITGGDSVTGERKYAHAFSFTPYARLLFSANEPPPTPDSSDAFFRRWQIVPFEKRFDPGKADRTLIDKLTTPSELSGLLNHGLMALPFLRERGAFASTDAGERAKERFRTDSDSVAGFLEDSCERDATARTPRPQLYAAYKSWCIDGNRRAYSKQRFNRRIENAGYPIITISGVRCWDGIRLEDAL